MTDHEIHRSGKNFLPAIETEQPDGRLFRLQALASRSSKLCNRLDTNQFGGRESLAQFLQKTACMTAYVEHHPWRCSTFIFDVADQGRPKHAVRRRQTIVKVLVAKEGFWLIGRSTQGHRCDLQD